MCGLCICLIKTVAEDTATSSNRLTMPDLTATCAAQSSGHEQATHLLGDQPSSGLLNQGKLEVVGKIRLYKELSRLIVSSKKNMSKQGSSGKSHARKLAGGTWLKDLCPKLPHHAVLNGTFRNLRPSLLLSLSTSHLSHA